MKLSCQTSWTCLILLWSCACHPFAVSLSIDEFGGRNSVEITTDVGNVYEIEISQFEPLVRLFDPDHFQISNLQVQNKISKKSVPISVFRSNPQSGGPLYQVHYSNGVVRLLEIHQKDEPTKYIVRRETKGSSFYQERTGSETAGSFMIDRIVLPPTEDHDATRSLSQQSLRGRQTHKVQLEAPPSGGGSSEDARTRRRRALSFDLDDDCVDLTLVHLAIAYDEEFCELYGSKKEAEERIQEIFAGAALFYEQYMCTQLLLTDFIAPRTCDPSESKFLASYSVNRTNACNNENPDDLSTLRGFKDKMRGDRAGIGLEDHVAVHFFTGFPYEGIPEIGCTYKGTFCNPEWAYGISYMSFRPNDIVTQIMVAAHEIGHTLGLSHIKVEERDDQYLMTTFVNTGADGFSQESVNGFNAFLDTVSCHEVVPAKRTITATVVRGDYVYFFFTQANVALYTKYDWEEREVLSGYPRLVVGNWGDRWPNSNWWPTGGFFKGDLAYLFKSSRDQSGETKGMSEYVVYDWYEDDVDSDDPNEIDWEGLPNDLYYDAAIAYKNRVYLFAGENYYKYDLEEDRAYSGYPKKVAEEWGNWPKGFQVTAGFVEPSQEYVYIFGYETEEGSESDEDDEWDVYPVYLKYDIEEDEVMDGYPKSISRSSNWDGILD